jgi:hypothetical protein
MRTVPVNPNRDVFFAGIMVARALVFVHNRRAYLKVMCRKRLIAEAMQDRRGGAGKITEESPRYKRDRVNHVWRVQGLVVLDIIKRVRPYLIGRCAEACDSVLERCEAA